MEEEKKTVWIVFNHGEELEFAECYGCGHEQEPEITGERHFYPNACPQCGAKMVAVITAEEVDGKKERR